MPAVVGRYWILTIPHHAFVPFLPAGVAHIKGQLERGDGGFLHWQLIAAWPKNVRLSAVTAVFGPYHAELTRSAAADTYVWKDDTAVDNTRFELGERAHRRNNKRDWDAVWESAKTGQLVDIDAGLRIQHYRTFKQIAVDHLVPEAIERTINVFWGATGTGKSRRAWDEAGIDQAYPKDPRTKFWDGYRGQRHVVIDEFRGDIDISHILRWFDRYPVNIEIKGSGTTLRATTIWITSNISPAAWYPTLDVETLAALMRRLTVTHFVAPLERPPPRDGLLL